MKVTSAGIALGMLVACVAPTGEPFEDVQRMALERGDFELQRIATDDSAALAAVDGLIDGGLEEAEAVRVALLASRELQALLAELDIARAEFAMVVAGANPRLEASAVFPSGGSPGLEVTLFQDVIDLLHLPTRRRMAQADLDAVVLRVAGRVIDLATRARIAFVEAQAGEQLLELRRTDLAATAASYELALRMRAAGNVTELGVLTEQALHEEARLEVAAAERAAAASREALNAALGLWGERTTWTLAGPLPDPAAADFEAGDVESRVIAANLELGAARRSLEAAAHRAGLARSSAWLPEAELGAKAEREGGDWAFGPALSIPLPVFDRGAGLQRRNAAELARDEDRYRARAVALRARARASASEVLALAEETRHFTEVLIPLRQAITGQTLLFYNAMQLGTFELITARREAVRTEVRYVETLHAYWRAKASLDALLAGGGAPEPSPRGEY